MAIRHFWADHHWHIVPTFVLQDQSSSFSFDVVTCKCNVVLLTSAAKQNHEVQEPVYIRRWKSKIQKPIWLLQGFPRLPLPSLLNSTRRSSLASRSLKVESGPGSTTNKHSASKFKLIGDRCKLIHVFEENTSTLRFHHLCGGLSIANRHRHAELLSQFAPLGPVPCESFPEQFN